MFAALMDEVAAARIRERLAESEQARLARSIRGPGGRRAAHAIAAALRTAADRLEPFSGWERVTRAGAEKPR